MAKKEEDRKVIFKDGDMYCSRCDVELVDMEFDFYHYENGTSDGAVWRCPRCNANYVMESKAAKEFIEATYLLQPRR